VVARVLVQPCDLRPLDVPTCARRCDLSFTLRGRSQHVRGELYRRGDQQEASGPVQATLVDRASVPP
jgi:hypothetical protein